MDKKQAEDYIKKLEELEKNLSGFENEEEDYEDEENEEYQMEELIFTPEFLEKVYPSIKYCPCCGPAPVNFNVNYN